MGRPPLSSAAWMQRAACRQLDPVEAAAIFFPSRSHAARLAKVGKEWCNRCVVNSECLEYALEHKIAEGIWAATSERERRRMIRQRSA